MHFIASKRQIKHRYVLNKKSSETFCAVSYSLEHKNKLFRRNEHVLQKNKGIGTLHFYSDGATAQNEN